MKRLKKHNTRIYDFCVININETNIVPEFDKEVLYEASL